MQPLLNNNTSKSTVFIGTLFEQTTAHLLTRLGFTQIHRMGGAGDLGVDLRACLELPPSPPPAQAPKTRIINAVVQCKYEAAKVGPKTVREFEGVLGREEVRQYRIGHDDGQQQQQQQQQLQQQQTLGILASRCGFSTASNDVFRSSRFPMLFVWLDLELRRRQRHPKEELGGGAMMMEELVKETVQMKMYLNPCAMRVWKGLSACEVFQESGKEGEEGKWGNSLLLYEGKPIGQNGK